MGVCEDACGGFDHEFHCIPEQCHKKKTGPSYDGVVQWAGGGGVTGCGAVGGCSPDGRTTVTAGSLCLSHSAFIQLHALYVSRQRKKPFFLPNNVYRLILSKCAHVSSSLSATVYTTQCAVSNHEVPSSLAFHLSFMNDKQIVNVVVRPVLNLNHDSAEPDRSCERYSCSCINNTGVRTNLLLWTRHISHLPFISAQDICM